MVKDDLSKFELETIEKALKLQLQVSARIEKLFLAREVRINSPTYKVRKDRLAIFDQLYNTPVIGKKYERVYMSYDRIQGTVRFGRHQGRVSRPDMAFEEGTSISEFALEVGKEFGKIYVEQAGVSVGLLSNGITTNVSE